jgi:phage gpG-like protein
MKVDIKLNTSNISAILNGFKKGFDVKLDKALLEAAAIGRKRIRDRTKKGESLSGGAFAPYTREYANFRAEKGRKRKPNLLFTGEMLGSMTFMGGKGYAKIKFSRATEANKAAWNQKKRPFFGLNAEDKRELMKFIRNRFK